MKTEAEIRADERARRAGMLKFRGFCQAASMARSDLRGDVPDPIAGESALLEACESVDRLVEIIHAKSSLASRRGGSFGIFVDESPLGREWQALDSEERAIRLSIRAAIRAAKGGAMKHCDCCRAFIRESEIEALRTRLAEVERERDSWKERHAATVDAMREQADEIATACATAEQRGRLRFAAHLLRRAKEVERG